MSRTITKKQTLQIIQLSLLFLFSLIFITVFILISLNLDLLRGNDSNSLSVQESQIGQINKENELLDPLFEVTPNTTENANSNSEEYDINELILGFQDYTTTIGGEVAYIAKPLVPRQVGQSTEPDEAPFLIIYSHGSDTRVTKDLEEKFMQNLRAYGQYFVSGGYYFAASNQHGENWGNADSVNDIINLHEYMRNNYFVNEKVNLVGFSMGGLPSWHYMFKYPDTVNKAALLAPSSFSLGYGDSQISNLKGIDIKIWHGESDVNVPARVSKNMVERAKNLGIQIEYVLIPGASHWDVDTELMPDILEFFEGDIQ